MNKLNPYVKAVFGGLIAGSAALAQAILDNVITGVEWTVIVTAVLTGFLGVWGATNKPADGGK